MLHECSMWAVYDEKDSLVIIAEYDKETDEVTKRQPLVTTDIWEISKLLERVHRLAPKGEKENYYVVRGTFIPEEKVK